jgi:hypothetical protein
MKRSIRSNILMSLVAAGALGAAAGAQAATGVYLSTGPAPVYVQAQPAYPGRVVHQERRPEYYAQGERYERYEHEQDRGYRHSCRAPRWNPQVRYLPGAAVWRNGSLYVATDVSGSVYNVNSPPEWTPNYWVPATCR